MTRALVLGGGGLTGLAWEAGVLAGLADSGVPVMGWDLVVGTSAGAIVGARLLADGSAAPLLDKLLAADPDAMERDLRAVTGQLPLVLMRASRRPGLQWIASAAVVAIVLRAAARPGAGGIGSVRTVVGARRGRGDPDEGLRALGRVAAASLALERPWIAFWERVLGGANAAWPMGRLVITAIDLATGARRAIDSTSAARLPSAAAASTALPGLMPAITIEGRRAMDGGLRSATNADLAEGHDDILVIAPVDRGQLESEVTRLEAARSRVLVIRPGPAADRMLGRELSRLDPRRMAVAGAAGRIDGRAWARGRPGVSAT